MPRLVPVVLVLTVAAARAEPPPEAAALQRAVHKVIEAAEPSVACILVSRSEKYGDPLGEGPPDEARGRLGGFNPGRHRFAPKELVNRLDLASPDTVPESYGSGVVIHESGLVLTNFHVIEKAKKVFVRLPGPDRASYADILAADPRADLAVLKLIRGPGDLKPIKFGDGGKVRKGDWVISLANPFAAGFRDGSPSASWGIISNLRRPAPPPGPVDEAKRAKPLAQYAFLIQTDARLNLGCSGGALLNLDGELIGLSTALAARTGGEAAGGYAIPMDANVKKMIEVLKRGEEIEYGFLGVTIPSDARSDSFGVEIGGVAPGMPAARAGLIAQDTIVAINGNPVRDHDDLFLHISAALAGSEADIEVRRNGTTRTFRARLAKAPPGEWADKAIASNRPKSVYGIRVDYASTMSLDSNPPEGVLVKDLEPGSPAEKKLKEWSARARLIVIAVDGKPVPTPADFYRAAAGKGSVTLDVIEATSRDADPKRERVTLP